eukprot:6184657-Pleurochrysis_carterae.AAC.3
MQRGGASRWCVRHQRRSSERGAEHLRRRDAADAAPRRAERLAGIAPWRDLVTEARRDSTLIKWTAELCMLLIHCLQEVISSSSSRRSNSSSDHS